MADDSIEIIQQFDNHPCNSPRGMLYYDLNILTEEQQIQLNDFKRNVVREDEKYLASHPQVRAIVALISRHVFLYRPRSNLHEFVGNFLSRPKQDLIDEIEAYLIEREPHIYEGNSAVVIHGESIKESITEEEEDFQNVPREMLDEIINRTFKQLGLDTDDTDEVSLQKVIDKISPNESIVRSILSEIIHGIPDEKADLLKYLTHMQDYYEDSALECASPMLKETDSMKFDPEYKDLQEQILTYLNFKEDALEEGDYTIGKVATNGFTELEDTTTEELQVSESEEN